jgi:hypothetical protein
MSEVSQEETLLQPYSVDQLGGFVVMVAGAIGSLLLVIWQSRCHCRMNLCYLFQCERRPPTEEEMKSLKDAAKKLKDKKDKDAKKDPDDTVTPTTSDETLIPPKKTVSAPAPAPEPEFADAIP